MLFECCEVDIMRPTALDLYDNSGIGILDSVVYLFI